MKINASDLYAIEKTKAFCDEIESMTRLRGPLSGSKQRESVHRAAQTLRKALERLEAEQEANP